MSSLLDILNIGTSGLNAQQQALEVAGQNLANINNPAYARQVVVEEASPDTQTDAGEEGNGVEVVGIQQIRDAMLDQQIQGENSTTASLQTQQEALQTAQSNLGGGTGQHLFHRQQRGGLDRRAGQRPERAVQRFSGAQHRRQPRRRTGRR